MRSTLAKAVVMKALSACLSLLFNIVLARLLGAEGAGVFYLALTVTSIASIVGRFGIDISLLKLVAPAASRGDWGVVKGLYKAGLRIVVFTSIFATLIIIVAAPLLANFVFSEPSLVMPLQIMALAIPFTSVMIVHAELLKAVQRIQQALLIQGVILPLFNILFVLGLAQVYDLIGVVSAYLVSCFLAFILSIILWSKRALKFHDESACCDDSKLWAINKPLLIVAIMNVVIDMTDIIMIGIFLESADIGMYVVALRTVSVGSLVLVAVNSVVAPRFSIMWEAGDWEHLEQLVRKVTLIMGIAAIIMLVIFIFYSNLILQLFGPEFKSAELTLQILAIGQFFVLSTGPVAYLLMMSGYERFHRNSIIFSAVINIILNVYLIPRYGISGAAFATTLSLTAKNILAVFFVKRKLGIKFIF
jgi:O-antigen/teichoic acid export membrane protein